MLRVLSRSAFAADETNKTHPVYEFAFNRDASSQEFLWGQHFQVQETREIISADNHGNGWRKQALAALLSRLTGGQIPLGSWDHALRAVMNSSEVNSSGGAKIHHGYIRLVKPSAQAASAACSAGSTGSTSSASASVTPPSSTLG